ncbi:BMC domain-containing protein [Peptoniphilus porci]|uniref:BMC domain protein n=1 Tax=Peptoniphilus porci TaxID=2652280 RepID=A0A1U7M1S6_9FIRM|nr:BMC domain-containing protein [Peptoniphilus porci]OLR65527.1 BMC domain protein [Peptoniphilus porci]
MLSSFLLAEFQSIATGYKEMNNILLNYPVDLFLSKNICPGRMLFIFNGNESDILEIDKYFKSKKISSIYILNIHEEIIEKINTTKKPTNISSFMICEFKNSICAMKASDLCVKEANIELVKLEFRIGLFGKSISVFNGLLSSLQSSKIAILDNLSNNDIVAIEIIENPVGELIKCI